MPRHLRRLIAILTIPLLLMLTSCIRMTADYEIISEDEVRLSADIGMQNSAAQEMGTDLPDFCEQDESLADVEDATAEPYADEGPDGYTGCRISGTASLADMDSDDTTITLADGVWTFHMEGDESQDEMSAEMFSDFRVSVTFPGEVLTHNGSSTVEGRTVTWTNPSDMFTADGLQATANDGSAGIPVWVWALIGALVVAAIAAAIYFATRKKSTPAPQEQAYPPGQPYGQAPGEPYAAPNQTYPQGQAPQGQPYPGATPQGSPYASGPAPQAPPAQPGPEGFREGPGIDGFRDGAPPPDGPDRPNGPPRSD